MSPFEQIRNRSAYAIPIVLGIVVLSAPFWMRGYPIYLLSLIGIFGLVSIGLNLLTGYAGQISLGHAAFFAIGAYATGLLTKKAGLPFYLSLPVAGILATAIGAVAALPALRLKNLYLAIATLGFGVVVQKLLFEWQTLTGGGAGLEIAAPRLGPFVLATETHMYYLIVAVAIVGTWGARNLARTGTGRAMVMLRESEIAASCIGINIAKYKVIAFSLSGFYTAIAGGLYCFLVRYINPESFNVNMSIMFLSMIVIGGLGTIPGSLLGAVFYVLAPELFRGIKEAPGLIFGFSLMMVMILMPKGLWGFAGRIWRRT
jgi:branched-chain amino acid transport system permease protein